MLTLDQKKEKLRLLRDKKILQCRGSFWEFQKQNSPSDFKDDRTYLIVLALTLQSFYQNKPVSYLARYPISHHEKLDLAATTIDVEFKRKKDETLITVDVSGTDILIIEVPPRHHKSHSLICFEAWILGVNPKQILITSSYNRDLANEFSQYVRDAVEQIRIKPLDIIYSDVFPYSRTKYGDRSKTKWALEGMFLSYTGSGILSPITGRGGNLIIFDDPIKGPIEAFNPNHLDKVWSSYTDGWLSRLEKPRKQILVMTPWVEDDPGDRIVKGAVDSGENVKTLNFKAWSKKQGMLCDDILDYRSYQILESRLDPIIFSGNYKSMRIGDAGKLYKNFKLYTPDSVPRKFDELYCYIDTADEGKDYTVAIVAGIEDTKDEHGIYIKNAYIVDVYISKEGMEVTEPEVAMFLASNAFQYLDVMFESNNGGRGFARNVEKELENHYEKEYSKITIDWFHQTENKKARINSQSNTVMRFCYFPVDWSDRWPVYHKLMNKYSREGENEYDDHADATTGIAERINTDKTMFDIINRS